MGVALIKIPHALRKASERATRESASKTRADLCGRPTAMGVALIKILHALRRASERATRESAK